MRQLEKSYAGIESGLIVRALSSIGITLTDAIVDIVPTLVLHAIEKYNPNHVTKEGKQASLSSWVYRFIQYKAYSYIDKAKKLSCKSLDTCNQDEKDGYNLIASKNDTEKSAFANILIEKIETLKGNEKAAMKAYVIAIAEDKETTFKASLARELGISREGARKLVNRSLNKVRAMF